MDGDRPNSHPQPICRPRQIPNRRKPAPKLSSSSLACIHFEAISERTYAASNLLHGHAVWDKGNARGVTVAQQDKLQQTVGESGLSGTKKPGYQPVRANQDLDAMIIQEMLERLYFSDVVVVNGG
jgi:hypothetical protein